MVAGDDLVVDVGDNGSISTPTIKTGQITSDGELDMKLGDVLNIDTNGTSVNVTGGIQASASITGNVTQGQ